MITPGTTLIERDTLRPQCFQLEDDSSPHAWMTVKHNLNSHELEKELAAEGWTFFYMAGAIKATAFGINRERMVQAALQRLITSAKRQEYNCLEIDYLKSDSFLGIASVSIFAHLRHLQKGMGFPRR